MPTYTFKNKETGEIVEQSMAISAREEFLKNNPLLEQVHLVAPPIGDPVRLGIKRIDGGMKEVLQKIKSKHRNSTIPY